MGIPKLMNYLSERYPCLSETVKANKLPQYDNFYIDLNFLIHNVLPEHEIGGDATTEIIERVLNAIETLYRLIRPTKLLFLAIDGVAPRAKWNKQRQRRFYAADKQESSFDSNCISPGTEYMLQFDRTLNEFIVAKMSEDKSWQKCRIVFNGASTPGEGSYKIVEHMRYLKATATDLKHCIFSGDTDFLMLGIAVHEIHVSLIRNAERRSNADAASFTDDVKHDFRLIHIEHLREYIELEFSTGESSPYPEFQPDIDCLADDWLLLCFFIGNDFLPPLPNCHVNTDIMPILFNTYKRVLPQLDGYINERGHLNVNRFNVFLNELKKIDSNIYENHMNAFMDRKTLLNKIAAIHIAAGAEGELERKCSPTNDDRKSFDEAKAIYYKEKMAKCTEINVQQYGFDYVTTIQWLLQYYYIECPSWDWHYPCNYAPFVSDFPELTQWKSELSVGSPAQPLEHLLAVQPIKSFQLLPEPFRALAEHDLKEYFPQTIDYDAKGKLSDWEAIPLIPFVKIDIFRGAIDGVRDQLSDAENKRNAIKQMIQYEMLEYEDETLVDRIELAIERRPKECVPIKRATGDAAFNPEIVNFSHLKCWPHSADMRSGCLYIKLASIEGKKRDVETIADELLNEIVSVGWPRVRKARVVAVSSSTKKIALKDDGSRDTTTLDSSDEFERNVNHLQERAIAQGIQLDEIHAIVHVAPFHYDEYTADIQTKEFVAKSIFDSNFVTSFPAHLIVKNPAISSGRSRLCARDQLKLGSMVFLLGNQTYYGQRAFVTAKSALSSTERVTAYVHCEKEPDFTDAIETYEKSTKDESEKIVYREAAAAAQSIGISPKVLARLTGSVIVLMAKRGDSTKSSPRKNNVGLQLKPRNRSNALNNFVRFDSNGWSYSQAALDLVIEYLLQFPRLADALNSDDIFVSDFAANDIVEGKQYLNGITRWLAQHPKITGARIDIAGNCLPDTVVEQVIASVEKTLDESDIKIANLQVRWQNIYIPDMNHVFVIPDPKATYQLFDRIIVVRSGYPVSVGSKGTIVAVNASKHIQSTATERNLISMDILMDKPYKRLASTMIQFKENRIFHVRTTAMLMNISHAKR